MWTKPIHDHERQEPSPGPTSKLALAQLHPIEPLTAAGTTARAACGEQSRLEPHAPRQARSQLPTSTTAPRVSPSRPHLPTAQVVLRTVTPSAVPTAPNARPERKAARVQRPRTTPQAVSRQVERSHRLGELRRARECTLEGTCPAATDSALERLARERNRAVLAGPERIDRQRVPVHTVLGGHREKGAQTMPIGQCSLHTVTCVLLLEVARVDVLHAPVHAALAALARHQRVTQLVKDQLRQAVVGVEVLAAAQRQHALAIERRVHLARAHDLDRELASTREPDQVERVVVALFDRAHGQTARIA